MDAALATGYFSASNRSLTKTRGHPKAMDTPLPPDLLTPFNQHLAQVRDWCAQHQVALGVGEMAFGAGLIALGVTTGTIEMGTQLIASHMGGFNSTAMIGSTIGAPLGAYAGSVLGSIGVVAAGTGIGIPAIIVIAGSSAILAAAGYTIGDIAHHALSPTPDVLTLLTGSSLLLAGTCLLIKGARRILRDQQVKSAVLNSLSDVRKGLLILPELAVKVVATSREELDRFKAETDQVP
ncbi:MAG: hypothetical protein ACOH2R_05790 [Pseudomonas sp.]